MKPKVTIVSIDDWDGIYVDGKCVNQGRGFDVHIFLETLVVARVDLGFSFSTFYPSGRDVKEAHELGQLPDTLAELKDPP